MPTYQVAWNATTKVAKVQPDGAAVGAGFTDIGSFDHVADIDDNLGSDYNHVVFHHVRDLLYHQGVLDMQRVSITVPVETIDVTPATKTIDLSNAEQHKVEATFIPPFATATAVTFVSSDPTKATVNADTGLVTPIAVGTTTITATANGKTDTCVITVQA